MPILSGDIKLVASQVMNDVPEGGGAPTATVIQDGTSNAIFPDISELDRAGGRVNLRKVFASVQTNDTDSYFGGNVIVAEPPKDPRVSVALFTTGDVFDRREQARSRVESYLSQGPLASGVLFGDHIQGQRTVTLLMRESVDPPVNGQTFVLRKNEGEAGMVEQYVRVTTVSAVVRTFTDDKGDFTRREVTLGISDPLRADFPGFQATRYDAAVSFVGKTKVYQTLVADAARYFGVVPTTAAAAVGDYSINTKSVFAQLVPSAQVETPIADARMNQQATALLSTGGEISRFYYMTFDPDRPFFAGGAIQPGTLNVTIPNDPRAITDRAGALMFEGAVAGSIDYENGILRLTRGVFGTNNYSVRYVAASATALVNESVGVPITAQSQSLSYVVPLPATPTRGSLQLSYRAQGRWYVLTDDGSGAVRGSDAAFGAGSLNFTTNTLTVTLGALPDVGSRLVVLYASAAVSQALSALPQPTADQQPNRFRRRINLGRSINKGTVSITWAGNYTATDDPATGQLTGGAVGPVNYAAGVIDFCPAQLPPKNTVITVTITERTQTKQQVNLLDSGANWTASLGGSIVPLSVEMSIAVQYPVREYPGRDVTTQTLLRVFDDGNGALQVASIGGNLTIGSINYSTGAVTIGKSVGGYKTVQNKYNGAITEQYVRLLGTENRTVTLTVLNGPSASLGTPGWAWWSGEQPAGLMVRAAGSAGGSYSTQVTLDAVFLPARSLDAPAGWGNNPLVVRSFRIADNEPLYQTLYVVQSSGKVVRNPDPSTGDGPAVGQYVIGADGAGVQLTDWPNWMPSTVASVQGATTPPLTGADTPLLTDGAVFRTATAPLRSGSFSVAGVFQTGAGFTATADSSGRIATGSAPVGNTPGSYGVFGVVDYEFGVVEVRFGRRVPDAMQTEPGVVDLTYLGLPGVSLVQVIGVQSDTLRYNATAFSYLPLDASVLGLDPVRLPADGRVPIFRPGSFAVVGHTKTVTATVSNSQTINLGRQRVSRVRVIGANGLVINTGYTADLEAGTVTFNNVSGYFQPVTVEDRIEDMLLVSDAQINGRLTFTRPLTHDYPVGSYVSSALVAGDMRARVSVLFDQQTWDSVWSDSARGAVATGTYNDVLAPIEVTNKGASTERWALRFTSTTSFEVIGEHVGVIATGSTGADCAPVNPATGAPYFTLRALGWGTGWSVGNVLRFNTIGALFPVWVVRTTLQGPATEDNDSFTLLIRGDVDRP